MHQWKQGFRSLASWFSRYSNSFMHNLCQVVSEGSRLKKMKDKMMSYEIWIVQQTSPSLGEYLKPGVAFVLKAYRCWSADQLLLAAPVITDALHIFFRLISLDIYKSYSSMFCTLWKCACLSHVVVVGRIWSLSQCVSLLRHSEGWMLEEQNVACLGGFFLCWCLFIQLNPQS